jgi:hypothetical protein
MDRQLDPREVNGKPQYCCIYKRRLWDSILRQGGESSFAQLMAQMQSGLLREASTSIIWYKPIMAAYLFTLGNYTTE